MSTPIPPAVISDAVPAIPPVTLENTTTSPELAEALAKDPELHLWLTNTGYFDLAKRTKVLKTYHKLAQADQSARRRLAELKEETAKHQAAIEQERAQILQELNSHDPSSISVVPESRVAHQTAIQDYLAEYATDTGPDAANLQTWTTSEKTLDPASKHLCKSQVVKPEYFGSFSPANLRRNTDYHTRKSSASGIQLGSHKDNTIELLRYKNSKPFLSAISRPIRTAYSLDEWMQDSARRARSPVNLYTPRVSHRRTPSPRANNSDRLNSYRERDMHSNGRSLRDMNIDDEENTRFFIIKSFSYENVDQCMANAVMKKPPSLGVPPPTWAKRIRWHASHPFVVQWLNTTEIRFSHIPHLKNPLNESKPIFHAKDGQEIPFDIGRKLVAIMNDESKAINSPIQGVSIKTERGGWAVEQKITRDSAKW
ncbi:hypothetical protein Cpir12675_000020 [Ceratocystis pirilliformis]|uniref:YTH domain-containing protein n=1 Tax=Ceratocystis pirilliformis TaxID=259994 RepID=A0ABR3ZPF0_9PEZI